MFPLGKKECEAVKSCHGVPTYCFSTQIIIDVGHVICVIPYKVFPCILIFYQRFSCHYNRNTE